MGNMIKSLFVRKAANNDNNHQEDQEDEQQNIDNEYEDDVQDAAILALAMEQDDNTTNYELKISCENLIKMDTLSLTDPMVVVYKVVNDEPREVGKTEVIMNTLDPKFSKSIKLSHNPSIEQNILFKVYDIDNFKEKNDLSKQQLIGIYECPFKNIILSREYSFKKSIQPYKKRSKQRLGKIAVQAFESDIGLSKIWLKFGLEDFITRHFIKFSINGATSNKEYFKIHDSPKQRNTPSGCVFPRFSVNSNKFPDDNATLKFEFNEIKKNSIKFLGELEITLEALLNSHQKSIDITRNTLRIGRLKVIEVNREKKNTFLNYIFEGFCLKVVNAIDFTKNDRPKQEELFSAEQELGQSKTEQQAYSLKKIGTFINHYNDSNKMVTLGFGAKLPPYHNIISHCFAINGNFFAPTIDGYDRIIESIKSLEGEIERNGPVLFSEIVSYGIELARYFKKENEKQYIVLLVVTNNEVSDISKTQELLASALDLPLSVLALSIGKNSHTSLEKIKRGDKRQQSLQMRTLEGKGGESGKTRSNFSYIEFKDIVKDDKSMAQAAFAEIPKQFLEYMKMMGTKLKTTEGNKNERSKKDIKEELQNRKKMSLEGGASSNIDKDTLNFQGFYKPLRLKFNERFKPFSFDSEIVEGIIYNGIHANNFNLMIERIAKDENEKMIHEMEPVVVSKGVEEESEEENQEQDEYLDILNRKKNVEKSVRRSDLMRQKSRLERKQQPSKEQIFTKDSIPSKKTEEWYLLKNKTQTATQKLLQQIESEENLYRKEMLPRCLMKEPQSIQVGKARKRVQERKEVTDAMGELLETLDEDKARYDKYFGFETAESKNCLICRKNRISIVFMNCGHMVVCEPCLPQVEDVCLICNNEIVRAIKTLVDEKATLEQLTRVRDDELSEKFESQDKMSVIEENRQDSEMQDDSVDEGLKELADEMKMSLGYKSPKARNNYIPENSHNQQYRNLQIHPLNGN